MYKAKGSIIGAAVLIGAGLLGYRYFHNSSGKTSQTGELQLPALDQGHDYVKEKMEFEYKKKVLAGPIAMQESLVRQFPKNQEARKKLAELYNEIGETEKAKTIFKTTGGVGLKSNTPE